MNDDREATLGMLARLLGHDASVFNDQGHAALEIEGAILHVQYFSDDEDRVLVLAADLGPVNTEARALAYPMMLAANTSWRSVAGGALALDQENHHAMLIARHDLGVFNEEMLTQALYAFTDTAIGWSAKLGALRSRGPGHEAQPLKYLPATLA